MTLPTFNTQPSQKGSIITFRSRKHSQNVNSPLEVQEMNILWFLIHICTINRYREMKDLIMWHLIHFEPHITIWLTFIAYSLRYKYFKMVHTFLAVKNQSLVPPFYERVLMLKYQIYYRTSPNFLKFKLHIEILNLWKFIDNLMVDEIEYDHADSTHSWDFQSWSDL